MDAGIWVAIISGVCSVVGVIITVAVGNNKTIYRIEQLEKKQDKHNTLIERMYSAEDKINILNERTESNTNRIEKLENTNIGG